MKNLNELISHNKKEGERLAKIAFRNNKGIEMEKKNNIDTAIKYYEENVSEKVIATHSYERLMTIYRNKKDFENEIRIVKTAIEVFKLENKERFETALGNIKNSKLKEQLKYGYDNCDKVRGENNMIIYAPYPVRKYESRLEKAIRLRDN